MSVSPKVGYGIKFFYGSADTSTSATATTEIVGVQDLTPSKEKGTKVTVKYHGAPGDRAVQIPGPLTEDDDIKVTLVYDAAGYTTVKSLLNTNQTYKTKYSDFSSDTFQGFIYEIGKVTPLEKEMVYEVTLAVSGAIAFATATV